MRTISVRLDDGSEARLNNLCQTLGLSQSEVFLAERLGLVGSFASATADIGTSSRGRDHAALLRQKLRDQHKQERQTEL
jgi:hypothetical protein